MLSKTIERLCNEIEARHQSNSRYILAIAGPPSVGKSTLAQAVVDTLNSKSNENSFAVLLPMDGFHLDNGILESRQLLDRKGAPETFDACGYGEIIKRLQTSTEDIYHPIFDRSLDLAIANAGVITKQTSVIVTEGNYLLLNTEPWHSIRKAFSQSVFLSVPIEILEKRLIDRWRRHGLDEKSAYFRTHNNDLKNARLILENSEYNQQERVEILPSSS